MDKYTMEAGLNRDRLPVIKFSPDCYDEVIKECRLMVRTSVDMGTFGLFSRTYPAICLLATMPTMAEAFNAN